MLEDNYQEQLKKLILITAHNVTLPAKWGNFFEKQDHAQPYQNDQRRYVRRNFRTESILELEQSILTIPREHQLYHVYTKDLSRGGISILHSQQLFPGERAQLWLPTAKIAVCVARCYRHNSSCYEIGFKFSDEKN